MEISSNSSDTTNGGILAPVPASSGFQSRLNIYDYVLITIGVIIVIMNSYVISVFFRKRALRRKSSLLLLSLALADLFTGLVTIPLITTATALRSVDFDKVKGVFVLGDVATVLSATLTILSLCAITMDRYARLCFPVQHFVMLERRRVAGMFCMIWLVAIAYSSIPFTWLYQILRDKPSEAMYEAAISHDTRFATAGAIIFIVPVLGLTGAFTHMFCAIQKLGTNERRRSVRKYEEFLRRKRERKAVIIFVLMFTAFVICWTPWIMLRPFTDNNEVFAKIPAHLLHVIMLIRFLTSIFNPLMYTLQEAEFSRAFTEDRNTLLAFARCQPYNRRRGTFSGVTDGTGSFQKKSFLVTSGKGGSSNSHHEPGGYVHSPVVQNGHLHPGNSHRENIGLPSLKWDATWDDDDAPQRQPEKTQPIPMLVLHGPSFDTEPAVVDSQSADVTDTVDDCNKTWDIGEEVQGSELAHIQFASQHSIYDNIKDTCVLQTGEDNYVTQLKWDVEAELTMIETPKDLFSPHHRHGAQVSNEISAEKEQRSSDSWNFVEGCNSTVRKPLLDMDVEKTKSNRSQKTAELLKTSFIGKLFDANKMTSKEA